MIRKLSKLKNFFGEDSFRKKQRNHRKILTGFWGFCCLLHNLHGITRQNTAICVLHRGNRSFYIYFGDLQSTYFWLAVCISLTLRIGLSDTFKPLRIFNQSFARIIFLFSDFNFVGFHIFRFRTQWLNKAYRENRHDNFYIYCHYRFRRKIQRRIRRSKAFDNNYSVNA